MTRRPSWLVVVDMQTAFADPSSVWATEGYEEASRHIEKLADRFKGRTVFTRFVRDPGEVGQWSAYYDKWTPFRIPAGDPQWELTITPPHQAPIVDEPTFSKWGPQLQNITGEADLVVCGVATECCVMSTALAAADAGRAVRVVADACAGATRTLHDQALAIMDTMAPLLSVVTSDDLGEEPSGDYESPDGSSPRAA